MFRCALLCWAGAALAAAPITVRDDGGQVLQLAHPARRIVSLAPNITELLYVAGAGDRLVGTVQASDYPPAARALPRVGRFNALDGEAILALHPDLVVAWQSGNPPALVQQLRALRVPVFVSEPRRLSEIANTLEVLGRLSGTDAVAGAAARRFRGRIAALARRYREARPVTVFYEVWHRPLMTIGGSHLISDVIRLCGGRNVFAGQSDLAPTVAMEAVLAADPEVIVHGSNGGDEEWTQAWQRWPQLRAVRDKHLFSLSADWMQRNGPRIADGAEQLCGLLDRVRSTGDGH